MSDSVKHTSLHLRRINYFKTFKTAHPVVEKCCNCECLFLTQNITFPFSSKRKKKLFDFWGRKKNFPKIFFFFCKTEEKDVGRNEIGCQTEKNFFSSTFLLGYNKLERLSLARFHLFEELVTKNFSYKTFFCHCSFGPIS